MAKVLVIDDSVFFRTMCAEVLSANGFDVDTAANGKEGIEKMVASPPLLVFLDLVMPEMNGEDMLKEIQKYPSLKGIPIIILTSISAEIAGKDLMTVGPIVSYMKKEDSNVDAIVKRAQEVLGTFEKRYDPRANGGTPPVSPPAAPPVA